MAEMELTSACCRHAFSFSINKGSTIIEIIKKLKIKNRGMESWKSLNHRPSALTSLALHSPSFPTTSSLLSATSPPAQSSPSQATLTDLSGYLQGLGPQPRSHLSVESRLSPRLRPLWISVLATSLLSAISLALPSILPSLWLRPQPRHLSGFAIDPALISSPNLGPHCVSIFSVSPSSLSRRSQSSLRLHPQSRRLSGSSINPVLASRLNLGPCHVSALFVSLFSSCHSWPSLRLHPRPRLRMMVSSSPPFVLVASSLCLMERRAKRFWRTGMVESKISTGQQDHDS